MTHSGESRELGFPMTSRDIPWNIFPFGLEKKMVNTHTSVLEGIEKNEVNTQRNRHKKQKSKSRCNLLIHS